jgi:hypothetical protein
MAGCRPGIMPSFTKLELVMHPNPLVLMICRSVKVQSIALFSYVGFGSVVVVGKRVLILLP